MLPFIRSDLSQFTAYTPHPSSAGDLPLGDGGSREVPDRLDTNECPWDWPEELKQKLAWTYQHQLESNRYPDGAYPALKEAIATYGTETSGSAISADQISVGNGSDELIRSLLIATCLRGEGSILVAEPTFSMYGILARTLGIPVVTVGRSATFETDLAAARAALDETQNPPIRAVFVVHPNSPTGNALTAAEIDWLREIPPHILVVIDEAYFEFSQQTLVGELAQHPNWVILRTFSKAFRLAAHRLGYSIAHPQVTAILEKVRLPYNLPSSTQAAAALALAHREQLLAVIPQIQQERAALLPQLAALPQLQVWPSDANFIFVRLSTPEQLREVHQRLKQMGTLVRHTGEGLRITIGTLEENQRTLAHLQTILDSDE